ncbi:MAG TPA: DUF3105 domain-containing protein [Actinomycetota bacterium]|nr:DUF3105 domain-containing protein [Actinomycetota bacterium]
MDHRKTTKAERKEQARREREEIERRRARARRNQRMGVLALLLLVAGGIAFAATRPRPDIPQVGDLLAQADAAADTASCTKVSQPGPYDPADEDRSHVDSIPSLETYASTPPASGPHSASTLPAGVYDSAPQIGQALHSLEHGAIIVWLDPGGPGPEQDRIEAFFEQSESRDHTIVAPYDYEGAAGVLPGGTGMALVSWHHIQTCARPSLAVAAAFADAYRTPTIAGGDYLGDAPEPGVPL